MDDTDLKEIEQLAEEKIRSSRQPRFNDRSQLFWSMYYWIKKADSLEPPYASDSRKRDKWLREYVKQEPFLHGVLTSVTTIDKNRGWTLLGSEPIVRKYVERFHNFHAAPDQIGWRPTMAFLSHSYHCADIGAIGELEWLALDIQHGFASEMSSIYTVDPAQCRLTGDIEFPLGYTGDNPLTTQQQEWSNKAYFRLVDSIYTDAKFNGLGVSAVSRCLELAKILTALYDHDAEQLLSKAPRGLLLLQGITEDQWETTLAEREATMSELEKRYYSGVQVFSSNGLEKLSAELVSLSKIPDGLDHVSFTNLAMYLYALAFKYDPREFWPVSGGQLGTSTETDVQHKKATGKGGMDFVLAYQEQLQDLLPNTIEFEFEARDVEGEIKDQSLTSAIIQNIVALGAADYITKQQAQILLAEAEIIHKDWAESSTQITTDKEDNPEGAAFLDLLQENEKDPVLSFLQKKEKAPFMRPAARVDDFLETDRESIARSLFYYPHQPIVKYVERNGIGSYQRIPVKKKERKYSFPPVSRGPGKGNWGHEGRPGKVGGSGGGGMPLTGDSAKNSKQYISSLSPEKQTALKGYTIRDYKDINSALRKGDAVDEETQVKIDALDDIFKDAPPLENKKTLVRGMTTENFQAMDLKEGDTFTDKGFVSTSGDPGYVAKLPDLNTTFVITAPIGSSALHIKSVSNRPAEDEWLLPRETTFTVTKIEETLPGRFRVKVTVQHD